MARRELIESYLNSMGNFRLDEDSMCGIVYDGNVEFTVEVPEAGDVALLHGRLMPASDDRDDRDALFARALRLNLFLVDTRGASIGHHPDIDELVLSYWLTAEDLASLDAFANALKNFASVMQHLRATLQESPVTEDEIPRPADDVLMIRS